MPALITHSLFGETVLKKTSPEVQRAAAAFPAAFEWGLQGPDYLFYSFANGGCADAAKKMHGGRQREIFFAAKGVLAGKSGPERGILLAYALGFLCHYLLDSSAHPFIYFFEAKEKKKTPTLPEGFCHHQIESDLDSAMYALLYKKSVRTFDFDRRYPLKEREAEIQSSFVSALLLEVYGLFLSEKESVRAFWAARRAYRFLLDPTGIFPGIFSFLDRNFWKNRLLLSALFRREKIPYDVLNLNRRVWHNPDAPQEEEDTDFPTLFERIAGEASCVLAEYYGYLVSNGALRYPFTHPFGNGGMRS